MPKIYSSTLLAAFCLSLSACQTQGESTENPTSAPLAGAAAGGDTSLTLPKGFQAQIFAEGVGAARHLVARPNGDVYVRLSGAEAGKCLVALRDADKDGKAERQDYFGDAQCGTGLALDATHLYYSDAETVSRVALPVDNELVPTAKPERIAINLGTENSHNARSLTLDGQGHVYVNIGAPSNACQKQDRQAGSPGQDPCPWLESHAGVYRFDINKTNQDKLKDGVRYATGIRNAVALDWHDNQLYLLQHGRDQLSQLFPKLYDAAQNAELPAEEFARFQQGDNLGWPYCYYDPAQKKKVLAPEYGGDGKTVGRCANMNMPLVAFPAHYAPNDLLFYTGKQFPAEYQGAALIAFHGSWNRAPLPQQGYNVALVPFQQGQPGAWKVFADGFAGPEGPGSGNARYRPVGLAQMPDGSVLVADSKEGRIWKISYSAQ